MYRICIVEDDPTTSATLDEYLHRYADNHNVKVETKRFANAFDFLESFSSDADAIFFDIEMPGMNGMEAAKKIREKDAFVTIVFVTNLAQYAIEGYSVDALDFILKPLHYDAMELKFDRIFNELSHHEKEETLTVIRKGNVQVIKISQIEYVEISNHNLIYHLNKGEITTWGSLSSVSEKLSPHHFVLANACYLVNLQYVRGIEGNDVVVGANRLPISKSKRKAFLSELAMYFGGTN